MAEYQETTPKASPVLNTMKLKSLLASSNNNNNNNNNSLLGSGLFSSSPFTLSSNNQKPESLTNSLLQIGGFSLKSSNDDSHHQQQQQLEPELLVRPSPALSKSSYTSGDESNSPNRATPPTTQLNSFGSSSSSFGGGGSSSGGGGDAASPRTPSLSVFDSPSERYRKRAASRSSVALVQRPVQELKLDCQLPDFEILSTLGTGTFGRVRLVKYLKVVPQLKDKSSYFALKILKKSEIIRLKQVDHILSEAKLLNMISHPFIVNMCASFQDERVLYMVLEYVPGGELFAYLRREKRLSNEASRFYASEIVLAYEYLHTKDIAYRDLKPENLLITRTGHLKIADFGFAKIVQDRTWTLCGTPEYLAPEIIQSKGHGKSVDWWALGILIFEMLCGYPPFYDDQPFGIYKKILQGTIEWPKHIDARAKLLISGLLTADLTKRLGCLRDGAEDVKRSMWFTKIDWQNVLDRLVPAPYFPTIEHAGDTSNFDPYDEDDEEPLPISLEENARFVSFGPPAIR